MNEKISCLGTEKVAKMNSPALMCQPVSASDNKNPPLDNERERNKTRKIKLAREGKNIFDTFDGAKTRLLNRAKKRRSVSTLSIPRASDRGVEWVDLYFRISNKDKGSSFLRFPTPWITQDAFELRRNFIPLQKK